MTPWLVRFIFLLWVRVNLAILLIYTVYSADDIARLPISPPGWLVALRIFWWQEILLLCCLIIGVRILLLPEETDVNHPSSIQYVCLALALGLARQLDWFYYFVSIATLAYYGHVDVPDTLIMAWLIMVLFLLLLTPGNLSEEVSVTFAAIHIYVSLLAGNFWGIAMGLSMIFNYTQRIRLDIDGMLDLNSTRTIVCGYLMTIIFSILFFRLMQDQSTVDVQDFLPIRMHSMQFLPQTY